MSLADDAVKAARALQALAVSEPAVALLEAWDQLPNDVKSDPDLSALSEGFARLDETFEADYGA